MKSHEKQEPSSSDPNSVTAGEIMEHLGIRIKGLPPVIGIKLKIAQHMN